MAPRIVLALVVASIALPLSVFAEAPPPTEIVPEAVSTDSPSLYVTMGLGPGPGDTAALDRDAPAFVLTFPSKGRPTSISRCTCRWPATTSVRL
jgi:hypothetical protein